MKISPARRRTTRSIADRRAERELFFWSAREVLKLLIRTGLVVWVLIALATGQPATDLLRLVLAV